MKDKKRYLLLLLFMMPLMVVSQDVPKDTLYGKIKKIKEKVIFLTEKENPQLLYYDDYGHSGFMGPESSVFRFFNTWYATHFCYYLNYEREFDEKGRKTKDIWYGKKDNFMHSYRFLYDKKDRLISTIDSSDYSISAKNHYFNDRGDVVDETIIDENLKNNSFSYNYKQYKNGNVIVSKRIDKYGVVDVYLNHYNEAGKLEYTTYKNPNSWKKTGVNSWSYGVQDSIGVTYKSLINEYDDNNRLIKSTMFDLYADDNHQNPVQTSETIYKYEGGNLKTKINSSKGFSGSTYTNYEYDNKNRLIKNYCCSEKKSDLRSSVRYTYDENKIASLVYAERSFETNKVETYNVTFSYQYDQNNNWIEIIKTVNGKDLYKWVRKIEYYD